MIVTADKFTEYNEYGVRQWLYRVQSGIASWGAPENADRFKALAQSISMYQDAPSRKLEEIKRVFALVSQIADPKEKASVDIAELSKAVQNALRVLQ